MRTDRWSRGRIPGVSRGVASDAFQGYGDVRRAYYGVASLIAARPRSARQGEPETAAAGTVWYQRLNLGTSLGHAVTKGILKPNTAESALHLMSRQSGDAVHRGLPVLYPRARPPPTVARFPDPRGTHPPAGHRRRGPLPIHPEAQRHQHPADARAHPRHAPPRRAAAGGGRRAHHHPVRRQGCQPGRRRRHRPHL